MSTQNVSIDGQKYKLSNRPRNEESYYRLGSRPLRLSNSSFLTKRGLYRKCASSVQTGENKYFCFLAGVPASFTETFSCLAVCITTLMQ